MEVKKYTKNFSKNNNYKRPAEGSKTDQLQTSKAMKEKLKNYEKVEDIDEVPIIHLHSLHNMEGWTT